MEIPNLHIGRENLVKYMTQARCRKQTLGIENNYPPAKEISTFGMFLYEDNILLVTIQLGLVSNLKQRVASTSLLVQNILLLPLLYLCDILVYLKLVACDNEV